MNPPSGPASPRPHFHDQPARRRRAMAWVASLALSIAVSLTGITLADGSGHRFLPSVLNGTPTSNSASPWPAHGQAALSANGKIVGTSGGLDPVPIASLAKMMTAYLVLRHHPDLSTNGIEVEVSPEMVQDTAARRARGESIVAVRAGERLSGSDALTALLLPSANNVAAALAIRDAGSIPAFVASMNRTARALGMHSTHYTDPSGYEAATVSTARDQLRLTIAVMRVPTFVRIVGLQSANLPVVGRVRNTNALVGHDGFIGTKTGSDSAAGGCLAFTRIGDLHGHPVVTFGVVLGQRGGSLIPAALNAAQRLVHAQDLG